MLSAFQGRGLAVGATLASARLAAATGRRRWAHAFPRVDNAASNGVCRKAGLELLDEVDFAYPAGTPIRCNDGRIELSSFPGPS